MLALACGAVAAVVLPLAVASAGQVGGAGHSRTAEQVAGGAPGAAPAGSAGSVGSGAGGALPEGGPINGEVANGRPPKEGSASDASLYVPGGAALPVSGGTSLRGDDKMPAAVPTPRHSPLLLGIGSATAARCGPELTSPDGVEAQTCVLTQGEDTWARAYYRNTTGKDIDAVLSLLAPGGRTVQIHCATDADDEPATCETPRGHTGGAPTDYSAVTEFATSRADGGRLLLRSGSD
ncbi:hypothetical protein KUM39_10365 [Streptomyces sp. J2-1]|nr:hypothetical protein [Streptomyces corallincola]